MYKGILTLVLMIGFCGLKAQQVVYDENAEIRTVESFTGIEVSGSLAVYLAQGQTNAVAVSAGDAKYNAKIKTEVKNGILKISVDGGMWNGMGWSNRKLKAYVTIVALKSIDVSGASLLSLSEMLKCDDLKIDVSGASEIKGILDVNKLSLDLSGASVVRLTGKADNAVIDASGAAKFNGYEFVTESFKADASGASVIRIAVNKDLVASASGGAHIYYKGNPEKANVNSSAGASIRKRIDGDE